MSNAGFKANIDLIRENFSIIIVQVISSLTHRTIFLCSPLKKSASYHFLAAPNSDERSEKICCGLVNDSVLVLVL